MADNPYQRFGETDLTLRDELALDRTVLANERTVLAYYRSTLALIIAGVTIVHFVDNGVLRYIGVACIPLGLVVGLVGFLRYRKMNRSILAVRDSMKRGHESKQSGTGDRG